SIPHVYAQSAATKGAPTVVDRSQMRKDFSAARKALNENRIDAYKKLLPKLRDYPLLPYLEYEELVPRLPTLPKAEVALFLEKNANSFLADRLSHRWLRTLASQKKWADYHHFYLPHLATDPELACNQLNARLHIGDKTALADVAAMWNVDQSQSKACDPVFSSWIAAGGLTPELQ